jgi:hypothetical protein
MRTTRHVLAIVLGGAALSGLGCGDGSPLDATSQAMPSLTSSLLESTALLQCSPRPADSVTVTVGPAGGLVAIGAHTLRVPEGALDAPVAITAVTASEAVNRVEFRPEGLVFNRAATLTMSYANCDAVGSLLPKRVAYVSDALTILEYLIGADNPLSRTVSARLEHFSGYAIAW